MNGANEETPESHEYKPQLRLQKQFEQSRARLPVRQKRNASEGSNSTVKREKVVSKIVGLKKKARKHRSDSKLNGREVPADISVKQPNKVLPGCRITRS